MRICLATTHFAPLPGGIAHYYTCLSRLLTDAGHTVILLTIAGVILGILALRKQDPKRGLAIAGLVLNLLCVMPYCLLFLLIALGGISTADFSQYIPSFGP